MWELTNYNKVVEDPKLNGDELRELYSNRRFIQMFRLDQDAKLLKGLKKKKKKYSYLII